MKIGSTPVVYPPAAQANRKTEAERSASEAFGQVGKTAQAQTQRTASASSQQAPLEAYALPSWMAGFGRDLTTGFQADTAGGYVDPKNLGWASASASELAEYSSLLQEHVSSVYENNGLSDAMSRYKALKSVPGLDERMHQQFNDSISSDQRMLALMNKLGVSLVPVG